MSFSWDFYYAMQRANIDSHHNLVWYVIERTNEKTRTLLIQSPDNINDISFNPNTSTVEMGYIPKEFFNEEKEIPELKRAVVSTYFINGSYSSLEEELNEKHITAQQVCNRRCLKNSDIYILQKAIQHHNPGIIHYGNKTCIAQPNIHYLATLNQDGKIVKPKSIEHLINQSKTNNTMSHFHNSTKLKQGQM